MSRSIADLLCAHPFFDALPAAYVALVSGCGQNRVYEAESALLTEGAPSDEFYVVREGRVAIEVDAPGRGPLVIDTMEAGEIVGVSWLLPPYRWTFDARASERTRVIAVDAACLRTKCDDDPAFGYAMYKAFAGLVKDRLQATRLRLLDVYATRGLTPWSRRRLARWCRRCTASRTELPS